MNMNPSPVLVRNSGLSPAVSPTGSALLPASQSITTDGIILAQQFDQDIMGDVGVAFENFVETGQVWALLIGFVLGYIFKSLTSYG